jgi:transcriptional regulator with XRE-family HTH domain
MARKEPLPLITELKRWRQRSGLSQSRAVRALNEVGIPVTLYSLQSWEIGRWNPRAPIALALAEFLQKQAKRRPRKQKEPGS